MHRLSSSRPRKLVEQIIVLDIGHFGSVTTKFFPAGRILSLYYDVRGNGLSDILGVNLHVKVALNLASAGDNRVGFIGSISTHARSSILNASMLWVRVLWAVSAALLAASAESLFAQYISIVKKA
jgi:hypothetical protein